MVFARVRDGYRKVPQMSVSSIGASGYTPTPHRWDWQNNRPLGENVTYNTVNNTDVGGTPPPRATNAAPAGTNGAGTTRTTTTTTNTTATANAGGTNAPVDHTNGGTGAGPTRVTDDGDNTRPPPPAPQSASAPGTGLRVNVIA
jgi:hypothetical protein